MKYIITLLILFCSGLARAEKCKKYSIDTEIKISTDNRFFYDGFLVSTKPVTSIVYLVTETPCRIYIKEEWTYCVERGETNKLIRGEDGSFYSASFHCYKELVGLENGQVFWRKKK